MRGWKTSRGGEQVLDAPTARVDVAALCARALQLANSAHVFAALGLRVASVDTYLERTAEETEALTGLLGVS
jgi:hypothetical protein